MAKRRYYYTNVVSGDRMATRPPLKIVVEGHEGYRTIIVNGAYEGHKPDF